MAWLLALACCAAGQAGGAAPAPVPVVLTTDLGAEADDQWALAHLAVSPAVELLGVVAGHAPGLEPSRSAAEAKALLAELPAARVGASAVVAGAAGPLADRRTPRPGPGVDLLLAASKRATPGRRVVVAMIGAATDVASAVLTDPGFCDRVEVVAMGFSRWPEGGDPWNVKNDVAAWQVVLAAPVPLTVGDEQVCKRHLEMTAAEARRRLGRGGEPLVKVLDGWLRREPGLAAKVTGRADAWPIWDEVAVAHVLGFTAVAVEPRPALRDDMSFDHSHPAGTVKWVRSIDPEALWSDLAARLKDRR